MTDGGGTVPPELGVARRLVERGHRVTVLGEDSMAAEVARTAAVFVPWTEGLNRRDRDPANNPYKDWELGPIAQVRAMADHLVAGPAAGYARDLLGAVADERPDLVLTSVFAFGAMAAAESVDLPFDVLLPNIYPFPADGAPPMGMGLRPATGRLGRARNRLIVAASVRTMDRYVLPRVNALRRDLGVTELEHALDQPGRARHQLLMTSPAFDFPADLPPNVRYVGPVLDDPSWAEAATDGIAWSPPPDAPLVLVALSSTFQDQGGTLQRIVDALADQPVRGLVTTGPGLDPAIVRAPANVTVVRSAPHQAVLPHAALVVTHGGHGTIVKSLTAGVPLVVLPHGRDQADNAVRVTERGAGLRLPRTAPPKKIARTVRRVLEDPSYARAAAVLGEAIRRDAESQVLLETLENLAT
ncbi:glycosyltransferase [Micromonospora sp. NPDC047730]|uniref:glycosyltransferase n=1 Tax=Micromonospora sp. NPDC047730 TaxID=3364253 RepID=UPI003723F813